jgi:hypothetical protein
MGTYRATLVIGIAAVALALGGLFAAPPANVSAFTGHGCTKATCQFFTSSYPGSHYYYKRCDSAWKNLSLTYLQGFTTKTALLAKYPNRVLHKRC